MDNKKMDRRVRYTKMVIRESIISLLKEKSVSKITVKEICERADINRATFYTYYSDPLDLLYKIEGELVRDITDYLTDDTTALGTNKTSLDTLEKIFNYVKENAELCSLLLSDNGDTNFQNQIIVLVEDQLTSNWYSNASLTSEEVSYLYSFGAAGSVGIIKKWLNDDTKKSAKEMADFLYKVSMFGTGSF